MDEFVASYVRALLWSECNEDQTPLDACGYSPRDLTPDARQRAVADCWAFRDQIGPATIPPHRMRQAGTDLALTRNNHGAGFWDGDWDDLGARTVRRLTASAEALGEVYLVETGAGTIDMM